MAPGTRRRSFGSTDCRRRRPRSSSLPVMPEPQVKTTTLPSYPVMAPHLAGSSLISHDVVVLRQRVLVDVNQFEKDWIHRGCLDQIFNDEELLLLAESSAEALAARYAAKLAYLEIIQIGNDPETVREVTVVTDAAGVPRLHSFLSAHRFPAGLDHTNEQSGSARLARPTIHVSLSHDGGVAAALVVVQPSAIRTKQSRESE